VELVAMTKNLAPSGNYITCSDTTDSRLVLVNDFLQFPNVITANGDGINDIFVIKNLTDGLGYPTNELSIYDRWGKRVYHRENITSEEDFWDPGAENVPAGTYFYRFVGKGYLGNIQRNGVVEVLR
jgi:gliding motility-associated-like protein